MHQPEQARQAGSDHAGYERPYSGNFSPQHNPFTIRVLIVIGMVATVILVGLFLWAVSDVLLLAFAGILLAIFLRSLSQGVYLYTPITEGWALAVVVLVLVSLLGVGAWLLAPKVAEQGDRLVERLPHSVQQLKEQVEQYKWSRSLFAQAPKPEEMLPGEDDMLTGAIGVFSTTLGALANVVIILFVGLFLAIEPRLYTGGLLRLLPISKRTRAREVLDAAGGALQWWLVGKVVAMLVIGVLTALGLWLLGVELALVLGLIAALASFIPNLGPVLALAPAVLLALMQSPTQALYVILLYLAIQTVESYVLTPLLQRRTVSLSPALTITAQVALGVLLGGLGLVLATPLTVLLLVLIQMLYIEDMLGDSVHVPGHEG